MGTYTSYLPHPLKADTHTHTHKRTHARTHVRRTCQAARYILRIRTHATTHIHTSTHTHTHTHTHAREAHMPSPPIYTTYTYTHNHTHAHNQTHKRTHTHIIAHTHTHTHTHAQTHTLHTRNYGPDLEGCPHLQTSLEDMERNSSGSQRSREELRQRFHLPVFTVSGMDFQKLSGVRKSDGGPKVTPSLSPRPPSAGERSKRVIWSNDSRMHR
jgi:hypothetical protein